MSQRRVGVRERRQYQCRSPNGCRQRSRRQHATDGERGPAIGSPTDAQASLCTRGSAAPQHGVVSRPGRAWQAARETHRDTNADAVTCECGDATHACAFDAGRRVCSNSTAVSQAQQSLKLAEPEGGVPARQTLQLFEHAIGQLQRGASRRLLAE